jgi:putative ABC transport system permease protein
MIPIRYNIRSLAVRKATTVATALGIALVVFVLASSQMLANGIRNTLSKSGDAEHALVIRKGSDTELVSNIETRLTSIILSAPGVKTDASGVPQGVAELVLVLALERPGSDGQVSNVALRGVPPNVFDFRKQAKIIEGRPAHAGADEVVIGKALQGKFKGLELGQSFEIKKNLQVKVVGVFDAQGASQESEIWCDVDIVRGAFGRNGLVSSVTVELTGPDQFEAFRSTMERDKQLGLQALPEPVYYEKQSEGTATLVTALGSTIVFFFSIGAIIGAMITMYAAVANRAREVGTLRALGFSRFTILSSFLLESVVLSLLGGAIGAAAALAMGFVKFSMLNFNSGSEITFTFDPSADILISAIILGAVMGVLGGLFPAVRAAQISPIEAMRE